jgi:hypothetical protein
MKLPWVSRRAFELLESSLERIQKERDEYREEAGRAKDALIDRMGFSPISAPVRQEVQQITEEFKKLEESLQLEDTGYGMISEEVLELADDLAGPSN